MKRYLSRVMVKAGRLPRTKWRLMLLLTLGIWLKSVACICWDVGSVALLIQRNRLYTLGMDMICAAVMLSLVGFYLWRLERKKGVGSVGLSGMCILLACFGLFLKEYGEWLRIDDFLFVLKYVFYLILTTSFWAIAKRFVKIQFTSLKFLSLFCLELGSIGLTGGSIVLSTFSPMALLIVSLFAMIGLVLVFRTIFDLAPVPPEAFIRRTDGIQDVFERPLVLNILSLAFVSAAARALTEAVLYIKLEATGIMPMTVLGLVWTLFGVLGLVMVAVLYHTRYIYTTLSGMLIFGFSVVATGRMALEAHSGPVASGYLMLLLGTHFYLNGYMQLLPRVLSGGIGTRLKKRIMTVSAPLGFVLCGTICLNFKGPVPAYCLMGLGGAIILITLRVTTLYNQVLFRMLKMRIWRNGPLMIPYSRTVAYLNKMLNGFDVDDVIYALKILRAAHHPIYETALVKALSHPMKKVRLFALEQMRLLYRFPTYQSLYQKVLEKDTENAVCNAALTNLILSDPKPEKYIPQLTNRLLKAGAVEGFLQLGGTFRKPAVKALKGLLESKNSRDNITALFLVSEHPQPIFAEGVMALLKHPKRGVVQRALIAAGALKDPQMLPRIFRALDDSFLQEYAVQALTAYGKSALPPIEKMIMKEQTPALQRKQLILFLGSLSSGEGKQILLRALSINNQKLRKTIIQNILDSQIIWIQSEKKMILRQCLEKDINRISWLMHLREVFMNAPTHESEEAFGFFLRAIQEDIDDTRELILYQLLLLKNNEMFTHAVRILLTDSYELYLPAMGMIQDLVSNRLYRKLKPTLLLPLSQKRKNTLSGLTPDAAAEALGEVIVNPPFAVNHWIRATALYALRRLGSAEGIPLAEAALSDAHPIVLEAAVWALVRLQPNQELLHQKLLTIPTSRLSRLSLDRLLES